MEAAFLLLLRPLALALFVSRVLVWGSPTSTRRVPSGSGRPSVLEAPPASVCPARPDMAFWRCKPPRRNACMRWEQRGFSERVPVRLPPDLGVAPHCCMSWHVRPTPKCGCSTSPDCQRAAPLFGRGGGGITTLGKALHAHRLTECCTSRVCATTVATTATDDGGLSRIEGSPPQACGPSCQSAYPGIGRRDAGMDHPLSPRLAPHPTPLTVARQLHACARHVRPASGPASLHSRNTQCTGLKWRCLACPCPWRDARCMQRACASSPGHACACGVGGVAVWWMRLHAHLHACKLCASLGSAQRQPREGRAGRPV